jgi:hypothetical protein
MDAIELFKSFIRAIRRNPWLSDAWIVFIAERNNGNASGHLSEELTKFQKTVSVRQRDDRDYGWWTDNAAKVKYAYTAREVVSLGSLFFMKDMAVGNPFLEENTRVDFMKKKFFDQMTRYKLLPNKPTTPFARKAITVTGKANEDGKVSEGFNDDLFFTFTMTVHMLRDFYKHQIPDIDYARLLE